MTHVKAEVNAWDPHCADAENQPAAHEDAQKGSKPCRIARRSQLLEHTGCRKLANMRQDVVSGSFEGIIGFPLAAFCADLSLDPAALERDVDSLCRYEFCAINVPAGISEVYSLTPDEAVEMVRIAVQASAGRRPVIGAVAFNASIAGQMARSMEEAGASALLVLPPYYPNAPFDGLLGYYKSIGAATGLPLCLYSRGWASFSPEEAERLAEAIPTLRLWKDGQADPRRLQRIMARLRDRLIWIGGAGDDCAAAYAAIGIRTFTSSISAVAPRLALVWGETALKGDFQKLNRLLDDYVHPLFALRASRPGYEVAVMKKARELTGRPVGQPRPPLPEFDPRDLQRLQQIIKTWAPFLPSGERSG